MAVIALNVLILMLEGFLAYCDKKFTRSQMPNGIPFLLHGGMWSDIILVSPILAIVAKYWATCNLRGAGAALIIGAAASIGMHIFWLADSRKSPVWLASQGRLSPAGWIHSFYMAAVLGVLLLFYFATPGVTKADALWVSALLALHVMIGCVWPPFFMGLPILNLATIAAVLTSWAAIALAYFRQQS